MNNIYVIPAPDKLSFDTVTILAAACSIPAILSLVSMWNKILEINWKSRYGDREAELNDQPIEGTNGATVQNMKRINTVARIFLSTIEIPLFGAAVLAIMILGELNFFSSQVNYQTEPIASIGKQNQSEEFLSQLTIYRSMGAYSRFRVSSNRLLIRPLGNRRRRRKKATNAHARK